MPVLFQSNHRWVIIARNPVVSEDMIEKIKWLAVTVFSLIGVTFLVMYLGE
jgi:hypothetical protein